MDDIRYTFTDDWLSQHVPVWDKLLDELKPSRLLEIGSYEGRSACYLIEKCSARTEIELCCVDTWAGGIEHDRCAMQDVEDRFDRNVSIAKSRAKNNVHLTKLKGESSLLLADLISSRRLGNFDLVHVDGSHQAPDVLMDAVLSFQLLRVGGLIIFDDYLWYMEPIGTQDLLNMPKLAIDSFTNIFQRKIRVIDGIPIYQLCVEKVSR
jgi:predicted O-methyltransferase YrrM